MDPVDWSLWNDMLNKRPVRVPDVPKKPSALDEIEQIINPTTPEAKRAKAEFIRDEYARIGNAIDGRKR